MKKLIAAILASAALAACFGGRGNAAEYKGGNTYPAALAVVSVESSGYCYEVVVRTATGYEYSFYSDDGDWMCGDIVAAEMSDNGTADIADDVIIRTRFAGFGDPAADNRRSQTHLGHSSHWGRRLRRVVLYAWKSGS